MNSLRFIDGTEYISSSRASEITRYSQDYIGQLCRGDKIVSKKIGRTWYVQKSSLLSYKDRSDEIAKPTSEREQISRSSNSSRSSGRSIRGIVPVSIIMILIAVGVYFGYSALWQLGNPTPTTTKSSDSVIMDQTTAVANTPVSSVFSDDVKVVGAADSPAKVKPRFTSATSTNGYVYMVVPVDP